jgi:SAM-dependent methyltransferase
MTDYSSLFRKYNLGCGTCFYQGYLNIGYWQTLAPDTLYAAPNGVEGTVMLNWDLTHGVPAADNSLDVVYHSHLLEHLTNAEGITFLAECHRVLRPGGLLRVIVPDLAAWCRAYVGGDTFFIDSYHRTVLRGDRDLYPTPAAVFMGMLHNHDHKMGYDFDLLNHRLGRLGFERIRRTLFQESDLPEIAEIEAHEPVRTMESLCVECYKAAPAEG